MTHTTSYFRRAAAHQALKIVRGRERVDFTADVEGFDWPAAALILKLRDVEELSHREIAEMLR